MVQPIVVATALGVAGWTLAGCADHYGYGGGVGYADHYGYGGGGRLCQL